jgi:tetratricopeptide (TPR) repeat protein
MKRVWLAIALSAPLGAQNIAIGDTQSFQARDAGKGDEDYQKGLSALDSHDWDTAIAAFEESASHKKGNAAAALYWKAYAQNKAGQREEALRTVGILQREYKDSRWVNDAQALEGEMRGHSNPGSQPDEEMKIYAINALMQADPDQALPVLERVLASNNSDKVKDKAMFVLTQSSSPKAAKLLGDIARGTSNPSLQMKAIRYIGMMGNDQSRKELPAIYTASSSVEVKRTILKGYMMSGSKDLLLQAAKSEQNADLRHEAIRQLAMCGGSDELWQLYASEGSMENKKAILKSMFITGRSDKLVDLAKSEKDPGLRAEAIKSLGLMGDNGKSQVLVEIFKSDSNPSVKHAVLQSLFLQNNGKALVDLARAEKDPAMKQEIVSKMSLVHSKEVTDYMMEILK